MDRRTSMGNNKNKSTAPQEIVSPVEQTPSPVRVDNFTRTIDVIPLDEETVDDLVVDKRIDEIERQVVEFNGQIEQLVQSFEALSKKQRGWIQIENKDVFYQTEVDGIFPNFATFVCGQPNMTCPFLYNVKYCGVKNKDEFKMSFAGYTGELATKEDILAVVSETNYPFLNITFGFQLPVEKVFSVRGQTGDNQYAITRTGTNSSTNWNGSQQEACNIPVYPLDPVYTFEEKLFQLLKKNLIPKGLSEKEAALFQMVLDFYKDKKVTLQGNNIRFDGSFLPAQKGITTLTGKSFDLADVKREYTKTCPISDPDAEEDLREDIDYQLLHVDQIRADLDPYHEKQLTDPNGGHWDLWEEKPLASGELSLKLSTPLVARDPRADVWEDGIIGIDFGTKSTVVVFQEDSEQTLPLRVGTGQLSKEIHSSHYENPTVLEFVDLNSFLSAYREKDGRPSTKWEQVTTSHTAFDNFLQSTSDQYYSYLYELKQWAGDKQRKIHLRDKQGVDVVLDPYQQLGEGEFDPIEIYAYYLGLYINNMHNGIYLDYLLSYPVAYEKSVRDRLIASFTRGIKKSLPESILKDQELMNKFRVSLGASEPVCYAICALEECGFEPEGEEAIFYGVFDFGGGTTDFDFGLYREATSRRHDYEVQSFGSQGDQYLGGENLLELLSFEVLKKNQSKLREQQITFECPTECKRFAGDEVLIAKTQEAKLNMAQMKETLRPLWERHEGYETTFETGIIKVNLFNSKGENLPNVELDVKLEEMEGILRARIEKGVENFFGSLIAAFNLPHETDNVELIYILKAGNSSKSAILGEVIDEYIEKYNKIINGKEGGENRFLVFPPLGTEEADQFMAEQNLPVKERSLEQPTCKTGVAFGLISSRQGGKIKLILEKAVTEEVKFPFFLGYEKRQKFKALHKQTLEYGAWLELIDAEEVDFTLYYSKLPVVLQGNTPIEDVKRKRCRLLQEEPSANVYIRPATPTSIEYVVATSEGIKKGNYLSDIVTEFLED